MSTLLADSRSVCSHCGQPVGANGRRLFWLCAHCEKTFEGLI